MKLEEALRILEFKNTTVLPRLKEIQKQFHRLSKIKHPDKNNGSIKSKEDFQTLLEAYNTAGKAAEKVVHENDDIEEIIARKLFKQFQFSSVKFNSQSITIKTEKSLNSTWLEILTTNLGEPTINKDGHGQKFTMEDQCEDPPTNIYLTLYHTGNLLVQAQGNMQSINIHFVNCHLKDLFMQVYNRAKLQSSKLKTPLRKLTKTNKCLQKKIKCPKCNYITNITSELAKHMKKVHGNTTARRLPTLSDDENETPDKTPISSASSRAASTFQCILCGSDFTTELEKDNHIKSDHELRCSICNNIFYDKFDLDMHRITHKTQAEQTEPLAIQLSEPKSLMEELINAGEDPFHTKDIVHDEFTDCTYCGIIFSDAEDLKEHINKHHETKVQYCCDKCPFTSSEEVVLKHHTLMMHVPGFECNECTKIIFPDDFVIGCVECGFFYHKQCTNLYQSQQIHDKPDTWKCHHCSPKLSENARVDNLCYLCNCEAPNKPALEAHMIRNHSPDIAVQCDICDKRFELEENLFLHMRFDHTPQEQFTKKICNICSHEAEDESSLEVHVLNEHVPSIVIQCEHCTQTFTCEANLTTHINLNHNSSSNSGTMNCHSCEMSVKASELCISCQVCKFTFHKRCTSLKSATGHWKPRTWKCQVCQLDVEKHNDEATENETVMTLENNPTSKPSAKYRKSNAISCNHPDKEYLMSQINTLKSVVAKREAELKKVQESETLKTKRIIQLEAQLREARHDGISNISQDNHDQQKIYNLEEKTNNLEKQVNLLFSKMDSFQQNTSPQSSTEYRYICEVCDSEFHTNDDLRAHKATPHTGDNCESETVFASAPETHRQTNHSQQQPISFYACQICDFKADTELNLNTHKQEEHLKCNKCSYIAIHNKDLRRHKNTMHVHDESLPCDLCSYRAIHENDLNRHKQTMHNIKHPHACNTCSYIARNKETLGYHISVKHVQLQRTRIFSSRRQSTADLQHHNQKPESIFRPWSGKQPSPSSPSPSSLTSRATFSGSNMNRNSKD